MARAKDSQKPTEYFIVEANSADDCSDEVTSLMENGWELHGPLKVIPSRTD